MKNLLTTQQAADFLGLTAQTLRIWRMHNPDGTTKGDGPAYYKIGGRCHYSEKDLDAWLELKRVEPIPRDSGRYVV